MNPYITQVPSYMAQDQQGLNPVFQNIGAQQQYMNQQLAQSNQLAQPMQRPQSSSMKPMDLAKMLRKKDPYEQAQAAMDKYGAENVYGYGGQGQIPAWNGEM